MVECAPGWDLVGQDENGCGGECVGNQYLQDMYEFLSFAYVL